MQHQGQHCYRIIAQLKSVWSNIFFIVPQLLSMQQQESLLSLIFQLQAYDVMVENHLFKWIDFKFSSLFVNNHIFFLIWLSQVNLLCSIFIWENHSKKMMDSYWDAFSMQLNRTASIKLPQEEEKKFGPSFLGRRKTGTTFRPRTLVTSEGEFWVSCKALEFLEVTQWMNVSSFYHSSLCLHSFYNFSFSSI